MNPPRDPQPSDAPPPESAAEALARADPFRGLPAEALGELAAAAEAVRYPAGALLLRQGGEPSGALHLIRGGAVAVEAAPDGGGLPQLVDVCGEGEVFGGSSLLDDSPAARARFTVRATEPVQALRVPREQVARVAARHPEVVDALEERRGRLLRRAGAELAAGAAGLAAALGGGTGLRTLLSPARALLRRAPVSCGPETPIVEAARAMERERVGAMLVTDGDGRPVGIATESDLARRVVAAGVDPASPVRAVMSAPVLSVEQDAPVLEALRTMTARDLRHVAVVDGAGVLVGVVSAGDLLLAQGRHPVALLRALETAPDLDALAAARGRLTALLAELVGAGVGPEEATGVLTALNDRAVRRVLAWAEDAATAEVGGAPPPFAWLALGSEGRGEQTLATDQDNALVHAARPGDEGALAWLERFARAANEGLERVGFARCPGGVMARNPVWRRSLGEWLAQVARWIDEPDPQALLSSVIFFDLRAVWGRASLADEIAAAVREGARRNRIWLAHLSRAAAATAPPLGLLRTFVVERGGEHRNTLDVKERGMAPLVDCARVLGLAAGSSATGTLARFREAAEAGAVSAELAGDAGEAFRFLMLVRLEHQLRLLDAGRVPDNHLDPRELPGLQRRTLKSAFQVVGAVQDAVASRYGGTMVR